MTSSIYIPRAESSSDSAVLLHLLPFPNTFCRSLCSFPSLPLTSNLVPLNKSFSLPLGMEPIFLVLYLIQLLLPLSDTPPHWIYAAAAFSGVLISSYGFTSSSSLQKQPRKQYLPCPVICKQGLGICKKIKVKK